MTIIVMLCKVFNDCFTQPDNKTFCPVRILGTTALLHYLVLSNIELIKHCSDFSLTDMANGASILIGVVAAGISIKNKTDK